MGSGDCRTGVALRRPAVLGLVASGAVVAGSVLGGQAFVSVLPGAWFFGVDGSPLGSVAAPGPDPPPVALFLVFGGLLLLTRTWLGLLATLRREPGLPLRRLVAVLALWIVPLVIAPPLFSRDVYSYAGQGEMVSHHIDPYRYGTGVLGSTPFSSLEGTLWSNSPSPYGPVFLAADGAIAGVTGHNELADLVALRLLAVGGLALAVAGLASLARGRGRDPAATVLLGAGSPLVLLAFVGGDHNDALMVGLIVAGLAVAERLGRVPGIVLCALAAGVKAPAALAVVVLGWNWAPAGAPTRQRVARALGAVGIGATTLAAVSALSGVGWGWTTTLGTANRISTGVTPLSALAHVASGAAGLLRIPLSFAAARTGIDAVGMVAAAGIVVWLLVHSRRLGPIRALGLMLLVMAILSPILWAWYLTWGLVVLSVVAAGRLRRVMIAITVAWTFIGASAVQGIGRALWHAGAPSVLLLAVGLAGLALIPLGWAPTAAAPGGAAAGDPAANEAAAGSGQAEASAGIAVLG